MNAERTIAPAALLFLALAAPAAASSDSLGTSSGVFLRLARTAREAALGTCGTGAVGASALGRNPAAIGERRDVVASRNQAAGGEINVDYLAGATKLAPRIAGGFSILHVSGGAIDQTDDTGQSVGGFTPRDVAATAAVASDWGPFHGGVSLSYLHSKIVHTAHTVTSGAGVEWRSVDVRTRLGLYATNLSGRLQYVDASAPLPRSVRLGARREWGKTGVVAELVSPIDDDAYAAAGVEVNLGREPWKFALRLGFDGARARSKAGAGGLGGGAGLATKTFSFDYAWTPGGDLGDDHLFTLGVRFKPSAASSPTKKPQP